LIGKAVFNKKTEQMHRSEMNTYSFDLSALTSGIYLLEVQNGNESTQTKFVIEK